MSHKRAYFPNVVTRAAICSFPRRPVTSLMIIQGEFQIHSRLLLSSIIVTTVCTRLIFLDRSHIFDLLTRLKLLLYTISIAIKCAALFERMRDIQIAAVRNSMSILWRNKGSITRNCLLLFPRASHYIMITAFFHRILIRLLSWLGLV